MEILNAYRDGFVPIQPPHISSEVWLNEIIWFELNKANPPFEGIEKIVGLELSEDVTSFSIDDGRPAGGLRLYFWQVRLLVFAVLS